MQISRRIFLKYCALTAASLELGPEELTGLKKALANPNSPSVLWLQGSGCSGCTSSFLNYVSLSEPYDAADVLIKSVNLVYHPTLSAGAGESVVTDIKKATNFILLIEGGVPTAFEGHACVSWSVGGKEVTFLEAVQTLSEKAYQVMCVGTCAAYGGISAMGANPMAVKSIREAIGKDTINVSGCPPHPNWVVETLVQLLQGKSVSLDAQGRPVSIYGSRRMCNQCPFEGREETRTLGVRERCMEALGCWGEAISAPCPTTKWNNRVNWCIAAGSPCLGCIEPTFPGASLSRRRGRGRQREQMRGRMRGRTRERGRE